MKDRKRNRIKGYDYSRDNLYFVTICVDGMVCCLGDVVDGDSVGTARELSVHSSGSKKILQLNKYGQIIEAQLNWLQERYNYVVIHAKVVMPNHVHAVLEIDRSLVSDKAVKIKSLSGLVGAFKTTSSKLIHQAEFIEFKWKRSFHDHIIKTDKSYQNITNYIHQNPDKWGDDTFNKK